MNQSTYERYEAVVANGIIGMLCRRCPTVIFVARNLDGDQSHLTLAELVESVEEHEAENHGGAG